MLIVEFDDFFEQAKGFMVSREVVEELFPVTAHVNGRIIKLTSRFLNDDRVKEIDLTGCLEVL